MKLNYDLIAFDMDGVLVDFVGGFKKVYGLPDDWHETQFFIEKDIGITEDEFWEVIDRTPDFFYNLEPLQEGLDLFRWCLNHNENVLIVTSAVHRPNAYPQKCAWFEKYLPEAKDRYVFTKKKQYLAGPNRVLIDDWEKHVDRWNDWGGLGILYTKCYNEGMNAEQVKNYLIDRGV